MGRLLLERRLNPLRARFHLSPASCLFSLASCHAFQLPGGRFSGCCFTSLMLKDIPQEPSGRQLITKSIGIVVGRRHRWLQWQLAVPRAQLPKPQASSQEYSQRPFGPTSSTRVLEPAAVPASAELAGCRFESACRI